MPRDARARCGRARCGRARAGLAVLGRALERRAKTFLDVFSAGAFLAASAREIGKRAGQPEHRSHKRNVAIRFLREKRNDFAVTKNEKAPPEIAPAADCLTRRRNP